MWGSHGITLNKNKQSFVSEHQLTRLSRVILPNSIVIQSLRQVDGRRDKSELDKKEFVGLVTGQGRPCEEAPEKGC